MFLGEENFTRTASEYQGDCTLKSKSDGFAVDGRVHSGYRARIPGIDQPSSKKFAGQGKKGCPISSCLMRNHAWAKVEASVSQKNQGALRAPFCFAGRAANRP